MQEEFLCSMLLNGNASPRTQYLIHRDLSTSPHLGLDFGKKAEISVANGCSMALHRITDLPARFCLPEFREKLTIIQAPRKSMTKKFCMTSIFNSNITTSIQRLLYYEALDPKWANPIFFQQGKGKWEFSSMKQVLCAVLCANIWITKTNLWSNYF